MPKPRTTFHIRLARMWEIIALLELQGRQQHADGIRFLLRWNKYKIDEAAIQREKDDLTRHSR